MSALFGHRELQALWTKAVGSPDYVRAEWLELEKVLEHFRATLEVEKRCRVNALSELGLPAKPRLEGILDELGEDRGVLDVLVPGCGESPSATADAVLRLRPT